MTDVVPVSPALSTASCNACTPLHRYPCYLSDSFLSVSRSWVSRTAVTPLYPQRHLNRCSGALGPLPYHQRHLVSCSAWCLFSRLISEERVQWPSFQHLYIIGHLKMNMFHVIDSQMTCLILLPHPNLCIRFLNPACLLCMPALSSWGIVAILRPHKPPAPTSATQPTSFPPSP